MVYASVQTAPFSTEAMHDLVERSRISNGQRGITAVLIHQQGTFLHGLEGEADQVRTLFTKVHADPRHKDVQVLVQIELGRRLFENQPMGFYDAVEGELDFGDSESTPSNLSVRPHDISWRGLIALQLLTRFQS